MKYIFDNPLFALKITMAIFVTIIVVGLTILASSKTLEASELEGFPGKEKQ